MVEQPVRSLEIVAEEVKSERQMQLTHFDSLDSKAGICGLCVISTSRLNRASRDFGSSTLRSAWQKAAAGLAIH